MNGCNRIQKYGLLWTGLTCLGLTGNACIVPDLVKRNTSGAAPVVAVAPPASPESAAPQAVEANLAGCWEATDIQSGVGYRLRFDATEMPNTYAMHRVQFEVITGGFSLSQSIINIQAEVTGNALQAHLPAENDHLAISEAYTFTLEDGQLTLNSVESGASRVYARPENQPREACFVNNGTYVQFSPDTRVPPGFTHVTGNWYYQLPA